MSGRLALDEMAELKTLIESETGNRRIVLDLNDVTLVDRDAVKSFGRFEKARIELVNVPAYIRAWIESESARNGF